MAMEDSGNSDLSDLSFSDESAVEDDIDASTGGAAVGMKVQLSDNYHGYIKIHTVYFL